MPPQLWNAETLSQNTTWLAYEDTTMCHFHVARVIGAWGVTQSGLVFKLQLGYANRHHTLL